MRTVCAGKDRRAAPAQDVLVLQGSLVLRALSFAGASLSLVYAHHLCADVQSQDCQKTHWSVHKLVCRRATRHATPAATEGLVLATLPNPSPALKGGATQCILYPGLKERILSQPGFPQPVPAPTSPAHRLGPAPGAGIGMYATRAIAAGELILSERPLLVAPGAYRSQLQRNDTIAEALARMSHDDRAAYTALSNAYDAAMPQLFAIWQTNNFDMTQHLHAAAPEMAADPRRPVTAIGKLTSRINHRCASSITPPLVAYQIAERGSARARARMKTAAAPTRTLRGTSSRSRSA